MDRTEQAERLRQWARNGNRGYYSGGVDALRSVAAYAWAEGRASADIDTLNPYKRPALILEGDDK